MKSLVILIITILTKNHFSNCSDFEPLCVIKINYDPILKIESIQNALKSNIPHDSWLVCPPTSVDELKSTVSKKTMFAKNEPLSNRNQNTKCAKEITPAVLESVADKHNLEVGFEVSYPNYIDYEIDNRQLNTHYRRKKSTVKKLFNKLNVLKKKKEKKHLPFISILSIKLRPKKIAKMVFYEIINAKNTRSEIEEIKCNYDMKIHDNFVNENDFETKFIFKKGDETMIDFSKEPSDHYTLIFLAPKQHLISKGKQHAACAFENLSSVRNQVQDAWLKTNNFIMETARKLGRLEIIAGASGIVQSQNPSGSYKSVIMKLNGHEIDLPEMVWRIVKYTIYSERNDTEVEFGIIIITSNYFEEYEKICQCVCTKNNWDPVSDYTTFCCPVNETVLRTLGIDDEILPIHNQLKISEIEKIEEKYEKFDSPLYV